MKPKYLAILLLVSYVGAFLFSCTKTENEPAKLTVTTTELMFSYDGGTQSISFSTNKDWTASSSAGWLTVTTSGKSSSSSISVAATANTEYDERTATITIKAENLVQTVNVKQSKKQGIIISKKEFDITNDAQSIEIEVKSNVEYEINIESVCADWISTSGTKGLTSDKVILVIAKNESYDDREGKIHIKQKEGSLSETVTIKQGQTNGLFITTPEYALSNEEHLLTIEVKANVDFEVSTEVDWVQYTETKALKTSNIVLKVLKNDSYDQRIGKVNVKQLNGNLSGVITITQDENLGLILSQDSLYISKEEQMFSVEVKTNVEFDVIIPETASDWLSVIPDTKGLSSMDVTFFATQNCTYDNREASVTIKQKEGDLCGTVLIHQAQTDTIGINVKEYNVGVLGGIINVQVEHNQTLNVDIDESSKSWISRIETKGMMSSELTFAVDTNNTDKDRTGIITISTESVSTKITVKQIKNEIIHFANDIVKYACVKQFDTDKDGELSRKEAAVVTDIGNLFAETGFPKDEFTFNELRYFTSLSTIPQFGVSNLSEITIPNGVQEICELCFYACYKLTKVSFDGIFNSLTIKLQAFRDCTSLPSIDLPEGLVELGNSVFWGCESLVDISLPQTLEIIGSGVFSNGKAKFTSVTFPHSLKSIGEDSFSNATFIGKTIFDSDNAIIYQNAFRGAKFSDIEFHENSVSRIWNYAFAGTTINKVTFAPQLSMEIDERAFQNSSLVEVQFSENSVYEIGNHAFQGTNLEEISLPSMYRIQVGAFRDNVKLRRVMFNGVIENLEREVFAGCTSMPSVTLPEWLSSVPQAMFMGCSSLSEVLFDGNTKEIQAKAFADCPFYSNGVSSFTIPESLQTTGDGALNLVQNFIITNTEQVLDITGVLRCTYYDEMLNFYVPDNLLYIYKNRWPNLIFYGLTEFPIRKPYDIIPEGFADMGLSTLWGLCNMGASSPEQRGGNYSWNGEDPVTASLGENYRTPSDHDFTMLSRFCKCSWDQGQQGWVFTSPYTGNRIFLQRYNNTGQRTYDGYRLNSGSVITWRENRYELIIGGTTKDKWLPIRPVYSKY